MKRDEKVKIKELVEKKKYNEIFADFGKKAYKEYVPKEYRKQELAKLKKEGRYEEIYNKYGQNEYNKILIKAMYEEVKEAKGISKAILWRLNWSIGRRLADLGIISTMSLAGITGSTYLNTSIDISENAVKYQEQIESYNRDISKYAQKINEMELTDIQLFMKVVDDMWNNIQGYATPTKDIQGYLELDLATQEGYGVCRNMASDIARKLNTINTKYNARTIVVYMEEGRYQLADIERKFPQINIQEESQQQNQEEIETEHSIEKLIGNHMVVLVDVQEDNATLVLDPTNPGIGIYKDGKIAMFNSGKENGLTLDAKEYVSAVCFAHGLDVAKDYIKSFLGEDVDFEKLESKYGIAVQNTALNQIRIDKESKQKSNPFFERMKVELKEQGIEIDDEIEKEEIKDYTR